MVFTVGAFERVGNGYCQNTALLFSARFFNQTGQRLWRQATTGSIVNENVVLFSRQTLCQQCGYAVAYRFGTACSAYTKYACFAGRGRLKRLVFGRYDNGNQIDGRMFFKDVYRMLQYGFAVDFNVLLGLSRPKARSDTGGGNQGDMATRHASAPAVSALRHKQASPKPSKYCSCAASSSALALITFK